MEGYGNNICLLDATYKTTRYSIPLYFQVINGVINVDYRTVGSFATQDETLVEALSIIKFWYQKWKPICFMVDNCDKKITLLPCK